MSSSNGQDITELPAAWGGDEQAAFEQLFPLIYAELKRISPRHMNRESEARVLHTALVQGAQARWVQWSLNSWWPTASEPNRIEELFRGRHFDREAIILCVRWYLRFKLSFRDLVEMMSERRLHRAHSGSRTSPQMQSPLPE